MPSDPPPKKGGLHASLARSVEPFLGCRQRSQRRPFVLRSRRPATTTVDEEVLARMEGDCGASTAICPQAQSKFLRGAGSPARTPNRRIFRGSGARPDNATHANAWGSGRIYRSQCHPSRRRRPTPGREARRPLPGSREAARAAIAVVVQHAWAVSDVGSHISVTPLPSIGERPFPSSLALIPILRWGP
jgi:hypothetical protein